MCKKKAKTNQTKNNTTYCFSMLESAPSSPGMGSLLSLKENTETNNFQTISKGLSTSLPDLDSEPWIEVKNRHHASTVRVKVK